MTPPPKRPEIFCSPATPPPKTPSCPSCRETLRFSAEKTERRAKTGEGKAKKGGEPGAMGTFRNRPVAMAGREKVPIACQAGFCQSPPL